jgi:hypothetical protein
MFLTKPQLPPELGFLVTCLKLSRQDPEVQPVKKLGTPKINWQDFLFWVDRHRVAPLVFANLSRYSGEAVPSSVMSALRARFESNAQRSLANAVELVRLFQLFQNHQIPVLPLKGSLLALQIYGNLALRHAGDLDIFIAASQVPLADRLLKIGYRRLVPNSPLSPAHQSFYKNLFHHFGYFQDQNNLAVELHWRPIFYQPESLSFDKIWRDPQYLTIAGTRLPAMSQENTILYLCGHGAGHYWFRLFWLVDLAEIMRQHRNLNWDRLISLAIRLDLIRPLVQGVLLAHMFLEAAIPEPIMHYARRDSNVSYLLREPNWYISSRQPFAPPTIQIIKDKIYLLTLSSKYRNKFHILKYSLIRNYWETIRLPDSLVPLYYLFRPLLFLYNRLAGSRRIKPLGHK